MRPHTHDVSIQGDQYNVYENNEKNVHVCNHQ